jgi:hypothetical protein
MKGGYPMALQGKPGSKETRGDTLAFILKATPQELLAIAAGTALRAQPLVQNFDKPDTPAFYQKTDELRRLIVHEWKRHADFRGMVIRHVAGKQLQGTGGQSPEQTKGQREGGQKPQQRKGK